MSCSTTSATRPSRRSALKAACLTAGLVTAFGTAPHEAAATGFQATNGSQTTPIYDAYYLNATAQSAELPALEPLTFEGEQPSPITSSQTASPTGNYAMAVFMQTSASDLAGQTFESAFLSGTSYTESEVVAYIQNGMTDPTNDMTDTNAYNTFLQSLTNDYDDEADTGSQTDPIPAYEFSNGQYIGQISPSQLVSGNSTASFPYLGFGLATPQAAAVPEPGSLPLLLAGGLALAGLTIKRRRRPL